MYYNIVGLPSYMLFVIDRNSVMRRIPILLYSPQAFVVPTDIFAFAFTVPVDLR